MSDADVIQMPIRRFWMMQRNIARIQATEDLRRLHVANAAMDGKAAAKHREQLVLEVGKVMTTVEGTPVRNDERDEAGVARLKILARQKIGQRAQ